MVEWQQWGVGGGGPVPLGTGRGILKHGTFSPDSSDDIGCISRITSKARTLVPFVERSHRKMLDTRAPRQGHGEGLRPRSPFAAVLLGTHHKTLSNPPLQDVEKRAFLLEWAFACIHVLFAVEVPEAEAEDVDDCCPFSTICFTHGVVALERDVRQLRVVRCTLDAPCR